MGIRSSRPWLVAVLTFAVTATQMPAALFPQLARHFPAQAAAAPVGRIYVSNQNSATVSAIDPVTNAVIATIPVGPSPYTVAATPDGSRVWVANFTGGSLSVIDTATNTVIHTVPIAGSPHGIAFSPSGHRAYVSAFDTDLVWVFDTTPAPPLPPASMATIPVGDAPTGLTMRPDGRRLYVANYAVSLGTTVSVIDTETDSTTTNMVIATITVGTGPFQIGMHPDGTRAYVANLSSDDVSVIDTASNEVISTVAVGSNPAHAVVAPDGERVFVTNNVSNDISVIDTADNEVLATLTEIGASPRGLAISPDGARLYVASSASNRLIAHTTGGSLIASVPVGSNPFFVTVVAGAPLGSISGIARCDNGDGSTLLPGASVDLYSGSVLIATTTADFETAAYSFPGVAPNATFTLRISRMFESSSGTYTISCTVTATTDAAGNATPGAGTFIPNRHNHIWPTAFQIASGVPITDYIFRSGQSTWFRIPVRRGQRVNVKVTNVPANYSIALYKDIRQLYDQQIAALGGADPLGAIGNLDASVAPDALSPDELSPDELSPDELSPDELSPDELSPDELSPDELSPDELSPDELSPDALSPDELSPDSLSPDELSPDELSADAYASAQTAALIGVSAHVGLSPEQITRNTWDNTGFFYVRVRGHNGAFDASRPFTITATVTDVSCAGATLTDYPVSLAVAGSGRQTLILTNTARLTGNTAGFLTRLGQLAARPEVAGAVVNLATLPAAVNAYNQWNGAQDCPAAANIVARSVKDVINAYRATNPGLRYIVIAGNDNVVPFFRQPDQSGLGNERDYRPAVLDPTASQASLRLGYVLTQDFYGSVRPISRFDHELHLPDLAVGRLVESITQMTAVIDAYIGANGVVAPTRALVAGYDFLSDAAGYIADQFAANSLTVDRQLIQPVGQPPTGPNAWTADQLRAKLFGATTFGIVSLNAHFSANRLLAADYATRLLSTEVSGLPAADTRFRNTLVLSTGCHSAYGIVDAHATALTDPVDWAQAFAARGATLIGGTGYQYGDTDFMKYSEKILADTALELRYGTGPVAIGVALANAKRTYVSSLATLRGIDEKAVSEATLYGLPFLGYNLPAATRLVRPIAGTVTTLTPLTSTGLSFAAITPTYTLNRNARTLTVDGGPSVQAIYYDINGEVAVAPEAPVLPQITQGVGATGQAVRGAVLQSATYVDEAGVTPFTDVATTEVRGAHPRYVTNVFTPVRPFDLNHFAGSNLVSTPFQFRSTAGGTTGVARRFTAESFRVYYSSLTDARALASAPVVYTVALSANPTDATLVDVSVMVGGLAAVGIEEVFATYTAETGSLYGSWASLRLTDFGGTANGSGIARQFVGSIPRGTSPVNDVRALVQAVGGNGLVTWASNNGAYYSVVDETATAADPKQTTTLAAVVPATGAYLSTAAVSATLLAGTDGLVGKRVSFRSGGVRVDAITGAGGVANAQLPLVSAPGAATVSVGFAEDDEYLGSGDEKTITVGRAASSFTATAGSPQSLGDSILVATLSGGGEPLGGQLVTLTGGGRTAQTFTDGYGRVRLDTADGFPAGTYPLAITYAGNDRFLGANLTTSVIVFDRNVFTAGIGRIVIPAGSVGLVPGKRAYFAFAAVYRPGAATPIGIFDFYSYESNLLFVATSFDWLAASGGRAEMQGRGKVNGQVGWSFRAVATDGSPDRFEVRIWKDGVTTYAAPTYRTGNALEAGAVIVRLLQPSERNLSPSDLRRLAER